jgi:CheY-like chemotaxis protein
MSKPDFDFGNLALSNTERYLALRSMTLGMCAFSRKCLDTVISYQNLLIDELEQNAGLASYSEKSRLLSQRMLLAVQELSGLFAGGSPSAEQLNLAPFCEGMADQFSKNGENGASVRSTLPETCNIHGDAFQLQQLFFEIWENLQHLFAGGNWEILISRESLGRIERGRLGLPGEKGDCLILSFLQQGQEAGLLSGFVPMLEIMEEEWTIPYTQQQILRWSGVMLAHGGNLLLKPQAPQLGMIFLFPVPEEKTSKVDNLFQYDPANNDKTILLVDDEDMIWDVISAMLQELGYRVILAENGHEAVEIYQNNPGEIDLVLLDMIMPQMSGTEAFFLLKRLDPGVTVLLSSGYVSEDEIQEVLHAGAAGFLRKPYHIADLARKVREILNDKERREKEKIQP